MDLKLERYLKQRGKVAIALSGGLDSSTLLAVSCKVLGAGNCLALTADSPYMMKSEISDCEEVCRKLNVRSIRVAMKIPETLSENPPLRCFFCKMEIFSRLLKRARSEGFNTLCDGTNSDDKSDYRPGMKALSILDISSPFMQCGIGKNGIKELAIECGLGEEFAIKPAYACLMTRFESGAKITEKTLKRVDEAEDFLRSLGFESVRVRVHSGIARIEIPRSRFDDFTPRVMDMVSVQLKNLGFKFVCLDMSGYLRGSMNKISQSK